MSTPHEQHYDQDLWHGSQIEACDECSILSREDNCNHAVTSSDEAYAKAMEEIDKTEYIGLLRDRIAVLEIALEPFAKALRPWVDETGTKQQSVAPLDYDHYERAAEAFRGGV